MNVPNQESTLNNDLINYQNKLNIQKKQNKKFLCYGIILIIMIFILNWFIRSINNLYLFYGFLDCDDDKKCADEQYYGEQADIFLFFYFCASCIILCLSLKSEKKIMLMILNFIWIIIKIGLIIGFLIKMNHLLHNVIYIIIFLLTEISSDICIIINEILKLKN